MASPIWIACGDPEALCITQRPASRFQRDWLYYLSALPSELGTLIVLGEKTGLPTPIQKRFVLPKGPSPRYRGAKPFYFVCAPERARAGSVRRETGLASPIQCRFVLPKGPSPRYRGAKPFYFVCALERARAGRLGEKLDWLRRSGLPAAIQKRFVLPKGLRPAFSGTGFIICPLCRASSAR